ncbi:hypothetical protein LCGC14_2602770 [marine sediment metagenome]|uniref:Uncharacterized protein n=1 Tax=marine sediment metagenome TaxID=412755 RepID=A0A0F9A8J2_9ZZZZ
MYQWGDIVILKPLRRALTPNRVQNDWVAVDRCIADAVALLWLFGYPTVYSCCGHGLTHGEILVTA